MMTPAREEEFLRRVREVLDAGAEALDPATAARLRRARACAVAAAGARPRRIRGWIPAAAAAGVAAMALWIGWSGMPDRRTSVPAAAARFEAVDVLAGRVNLDLYENLDFYAWLADGSGRG